MKRAMTLTVGFFASVLAWVAPFHEAWAAGAPRDPFNGRQSYSGSNMACLVANDFYAVHFTAMKQGRQPGETSDFVKYCQEVPAIGKLYLSIDFLDRDARNTPVSLRVVEESVSEDGRSVEIAKTLGELAPRIYRNGTADTQVVVDHPGHYAVIAEFGEAPFSEDDRLRIPFTVGLPAPTNYSKLFGRVTGALVIGFFSVMAIIGYRSLRRPAVRPSLAEEKTSLATEAPQPLSLSASGQTSHSKG